MVFLPIDLIRSRVISTTRVSGSQVLLVGGGSGLSLSQIGARPRHRAHLTGRIPTAPTRPLTTIGLFTILGALCFQYIGGYEPLRTVPAAALVLLISACLCWRLAHRPVAALVPVPALHRGNRDRVPDLLCGDLSRHLSCQCRNGASGPYPTSPAPDFGDGGAFSDLTNLNAKKGRALRQGAMAVPRFVLCRL